jgi:hypothetical protein
MSCQQEFDVIEEVRSSKEEMDYEEPYEWTCHRKETDDDLIEIDN